MRILSLQERQLLDQLHTRKIKLRLDGSGRLYYFSEGELPHDLLEEIRRYRKELIEILEVERHWEPVAEWEFSKLALPSQSEPGRTDVWLIGIRVDDPAEMCWFVETV